VYLFEFFYLPVTLPSVLVEPSS